MTQLRLALGMRGGVSLAVWIGGACAEIDVLRCATPGDGTFWGDRLTEAGNTSVHVDVMAGASAGGLNAVLFAAAQHYGFPFAKTREIWLDKGDIRGLLRPDVPEAPSLLDGDAGFLQVMFDALRDLVDEANGGHPTSTGSSEETQPTIDVRLSATHVEPIVRRTPSPSDEQLTVKRSGAAFRFRHTAGHDWMPSDFPPYAPPESVGRPQLEAALWRLVLAARATSSFPVAFEAASVRSRRPGSFSESPPDQPGPDVDAFGIFSDARRYSEDREDFMILDGGWLDNIPLKRALEAIAGAPAEGLTRRCLVYLHPGEPTSMEAPTLDGGPSDEERRLRRQRQRRSTINVGKGMVQAVWSSETIAADIEALEHHNRSVSSGQVLRAAALGGIGADCSAFDAASITLPAYLPLRSTYDAAKLRALLDDPISYMGEDPFPTSVPEPRAPLAGWTVQDRTNLDGVLGQKFNLAATPGGVTPSAMLDGSLILNGLGPLSRVTRLTLEWVCHLQTNGADVGPHKQTLYRTLLFLGEALDRNRRMSWVLSACLRGAAPAASRGDLGTWTDTSMRDANRLLLHEPALADSVIVELNGGQPGGIQELAGLCAGLLDQQAAGTVVGSVNGLHDIRSRVFDDVLVPLVKSLATVEVADEESAGGLLHRAIGNRSAPSSPPGPDTAAAGLSAIEVLGMAEFLYGAPGERDIEFQRLSAANPTPLGVDLTALQAYATSMEIPWPKPDEVPVKLKLAGNELMNFAAFLRVDWRANDWMWGRLDSVRTLVDLLVPIDPGLDQAADYLAIESRDAIVRARQIEILRAELALRPWDQPTEPDGLVSEATVTDFLNSYMVGTENVTSNRSLDTVEIAQQLSTAAANAIRWNASLVGHSLDGPGAITQTAGVVANVVSIAGRLGASLALAPRQATSNQRFVRTAFRFAVSLVIVAAITVPLGWATLTNWKVAAVAAAGVLTFVIVVLGIVLWLWLRPGVRRRALWVLLAVGAAAAVAAAFLFSI